MENDGDDDDDDNDDNADDDEKVYNPFAGAFFA